MKLKTAKVKVLSTGNADVYQATVHGERIGPCRKGDIIEVPVTKPRQQPTLSGVTVEDIPVLDELLTHKPGWFEVVDEGGKKKGGSGTGIG